MGMDLYIYSARNHEVFKHEYWNNPDVEQVFYARKAWHFPEHCDFIPKDYESGEMFEITPENVENMINVACHYRNYWGEYSDIEKLCLLRDHMEMELNRYEETGQKPMHYYMGWDW